MNENDTASDIDGNIKGSSVFKNIEESIELQKHVKNESNVIIDVYNDDIELSSIKDSDTDAERIKKLIQTNLKKKDNINHDYNASILYIIYL